MGRWGWGGGFGSVLCTISPFILSGSGSSPNNTGLFPNPGTLLSPSLSLCHHPFYSFKGTLHIKCTKLTFAFALFHKALHRASPLKLGMKTLPSLYSISQRLGTPGGGKWAGEDGVKLWNEHWTGSSGPRSWNSNSLPASGCSTKMPSQAPPLYSSWCILPTVGLKRAQTNMMKPKMFSGPRILWLFLEERWGMWLKGSVKEGWVSWAAGPVQMTADSHSLQMIWKVRSWDCPPHLETSSNGQQLTNKKIKGLLWWSCS